MELGVTEHVCTSGDWQPGNWLAWLFRNGARREGFNPIIFSNYLSYKMRKKGLDRGGKPVRDPIQG